MSTFASYKVENSSPARSSSRSLELKLSQKPFSQGLPGSMKSVFTPIRPSQARTCVDEFTWRCLAIVVARKFNSDDMLDCLTSLRRGHRGIIPPRSGPGAPTPASPEVADKALAHALRGLEAPTTGPQMVERRKPVLQAWADHLTGETESDEAKAVQITGRR